ncbi:hypothetical protein LAD67_06345 [Escherichia coli]|nr:hypothetical protein [Escherichia coli]
MINRFIGRSGRRLFQIKKSASAYLLFSHRYGEHSTSHGDDYAMHFLHASAMLSTWLAYFVRIRALLSCRLPVSNADEPANIFQVTSTRAIPH